MKLDQLVGVCATALFCGITFTPVTVRAGNNSWTNTSGGNWIDGSNWSGGAPSSNFGILYITNATSKIVALWDGFTPASTLIVSNLDVSAPGTSTNTLNLGYNSLGQSFPMADGPLQILDVLVIGVGGAFVQGVATTMVEGVSGFFSTAFVDDGSVTISNGLLVVTNAAINIGATGQFNLDGGTVLAKQLAASSPGGTINLNSGSLVSQSTIVSNGQDFTIGSSGGGSATFMANGGAHTIQNNLIVGGATSNNILVVSNAARVFNGYGYIGLNPDSLYNIGTVTGPGSFWINSNNLSVGYYGSVNTLIIANGGVVSNIYGNIGYEGNADYNAVDIFDTGSVWNNSGTMTVGTSGFGNSLYILNGGAVFDTDGYIGYNASANTNDVHVIGAGSVWNNSADVYVGYYGSGNTLSIDPGSAFVQGVNNTYGFIGENPGANGNSVLVRGTGSVWNNSADIYVSNDNNSSNSLTIGNGGRVVSADGFIGAYSLFSSNNWVLVTDTGSVWNNSANLYVGYPGSGNTLTISNGGAVFNANGYIGYSDTFYNTGANNNAVIVIGSGSVWNTTNLYVGYWGSGNTLIVSNTGSVFVTNAAGNATLVVSRFGGTNSLIINGGSVTVNELIATNDQNCVVTFQAGLIASGGTRLLTDHLFAVGDGTDAATFQLNGGVHSFANNLEIRSYAFLTGCGTIEGNVTVDPGGTVLANCGGTLTFIGIVTNNGTMQAVNGSVLQAYGQMVNNGVIIATNGSTEFLGGLVNNGVVLTETDVQISSITRSGNNITIQIPSVNDATYQLQVTPSLKPTNWTDVSISQSGTGGVLSFTDTGGATNHPGRFYRIDVTVP